MELLGVELDRFEIYKIENRKMIVKDFELIALSIVLDIPFDEIKKLIDFWLCQVKCVIFFESLKFL